MDSKEITKNQRNKNRIMNALNIAAYMLLVWILIFCIYSINRYIDAFSTESCFENLKTATEQLADEIKTKAESNEKMLIILADILAGSDELPLEDTAHTLSFYSEGSIFSKLAVLLPGNMVLNQNGTMTDAAGILSFEEEAASGIHISARQESLQKEEGDVLRHFAPIIKEGQTIGLLYGVIELERMPEIFSTAIYNWDTQQYIVEGNSGGFLMDTWHETPENISSLLTRSILPGYDVNKTLDDIANGRSGSIAFLSKNANENFYMYYTPVAINDWVVMLTVSETTAFRKSSLLNTHMLNLFGIMIIAFICFLILFMARTYTNIKMYEDQLNRVHYMLNLQEILFEAHRNDKAIHMALSETAKVMRAKQTFLFLLDNTCIVKEYTGIHDTGILDDFWGTIDLIKEAPSWYRQFLNQKSIRVNSFDTEPLFKRFKAQNLIITPIFNSNKELQALLGAMNMPHLPKSAYKLEIGTISFSMALDNMDVHVKLETMGSMDYDTGVMNKNSYLKYTSQFNSREMECFCCIYIDVNGLHEWNNTHGHEAGDLMLKFIAQAFANYFHKAHVYRIGGDEFVIMYPNIGLADVEKKIRYAREEIEAEGYYVSIGVAWRNSDINIRDMIREADTKMYQDKSDFYKKHDRRTRNIKEG